MLKVVNNTVTATRGDSVYLNIKLTKNGEDYEMAEGDTLTLTIKKTTSSKKALISKTFEDLTVKIESGDTDSLEYGTYYYDVQLTSANGDIDTVIPPTKFVIAEEVTF